ncbi:MAG: mercury methylation ferredoxin HgcB [Acidobacteriota bacterium]
MIEHRYLSNVTTLRYEPAKCTGCGMCAEVCPHRLFQMDGKKAALTNRDLCMECGACVRNCPFDAISVRPGVGCAWAISISRLRGRETPSCG